MGKNNRDRRKAKLKKRKAAAQAGSGRVTPPGGGGKIESGPRSGIDPGFGFEPGFGFGFNDGFGFGSGFDDEPGCGPECGCEGDDRYEPPATDSEFATSLWTFLAHGPQQGRDRDRAIDELMTMEVGTVRRAAETILGQIIALRWTDHWLPAEVIRHAARSTSSAGAEIAGAAIVADHANRSPDTLHPRWAAHLAELDLPSTPGTGWLTTYLSRVFLRSHHLTLDDALLLVADLIRHLDNGIKLEEIIPAPGSKGAAETGLADRVPTASPVLDRVRHLLAQAESTTFDAEAEAFTAKAQELMARHSLDEALVWSRSGRSDRPAVTRLPVDDPYATAKQYLLHVVAEAMGCRAVAYNSLGLVAIIGFDADLHAVETLFTSLLVQAQSAMQRAAASAPPGAHSRSRRFRSSFLTAYAQRIGERLGEINDHVRQEAESASGDDLLPVLASRSLLIDDEVDRLFGELRTTSVGGARDVAGSVAGRSAADQAELHDAVTR